MPIIRDGNRFNGMKAEFPAVRGENILVPQDAVFSWNIAQHHIRAGLCLATPDIGQAGTPVIFFVKIKYIIPWWKYSGCQSNDYLVQKLPWHGSSGMPACI
ncbi:hypothetical protein [Novacetimonas pomaceti]|uniref:hypothetical protein n=1 Tax=Novacetimonas pomaceti TaxID=2021998 RepID=UPI0030B8ADBA